MRTHEAFIGLRPEDFLDIIVDAVIVIDEEQRIMLFNAAAETVFGYRAEEILGQSIDLLIPSRFIEAHRGHIRDFAAEHSRVRYMSERPEIAGRRKDGSEFPAEGSIGKLEGPNGILFTISLRDISRRKHNEQELVKWAHVFEHSEWGIVIGRAEATVLETMNPAFARLYGYSVEELAGRPIKDVYAPEDREKVPGLLRLAHEKGHITFEARHLRKDGTVFPALVDITAVKDPQGQVLYRVVNVQDISERKKAEKALRESEARYKSIIAAMDEGIVLHDASGAIILCNSSAEQILGLSADQIMGRTSMDPRWRTIHPDGSPFPGEMHPAMVTLHTGKPSTNVTMGVHKPAGGLSWISINTQPLFRPEETAPYAAVASFTDITDRLQAYQLLEQRVNERTCELTALLEVSRDVASTLELKPLLTIFFERLRKVVDYSNAGIARLEGDQFVMIEFDGSISRERMLQFRMQASLDSAYSRIMDTRQPVIIGDLWETNPWIRSLQEASGAEYRQLYRDIRSWIGVPLVARDKVIGILRLDHTQPNFYTEDRVRLVKAFADHAAIAIENARLYEQAQSLAALQERQKLARELHDSVSQALYGIGLGVRTAQALLERDPLKAAEPLEYCLSLAEAGLAEMRALIFELRPESLELEGLVAALSKQAAAMRARYSVQVEEAYCPEPQVPLRVKETLYRIGQEALQNVIKHAHASQVALCLGQTPGTLTLEIRDNGDGFVVADSYPGHLGIKSMRERAEHIGGSFNIESVPGQGTVIRVNVPAHNP